MEKRKKFKILKRILPIICAVLCLATALTMPIGAVINSSQGSYNNYDITGRSTFPMTVGFSYATRDLSTGAGASYVYSTYVGQYGVEFNDTKYGNEQYTLEYDPYGNGSTTYDVTGKLVYSLGAEEWGVSTEVETNSSFRLGRRRISMTNNTPESSNVAGLQQGVVLRADDIAFNPHTIVDSWELETTVVGGQTINRYTYSLKDEMDWSYSVPSFLTPTPLAYTNNLGIEMTYSWRAEVMDNNGTVRSYSGTATYDNRTSGYQQELVPIMSAEALLGQIGGYGNGGQISDTIVIENYYGYLEYKYYEYQAPQIEFTLNGTTYACPYGITWGEYANLDTTEYPASSNADVRWRDSEDGTGMQFNNNGIWQFILYNGEYVDNTDTIIGRAVYTLEEPTNVKAELVGTWIRNPNITTFDLNITKRLVTCESSQYDLIGAIVSYTDYSGVHTYDVNFVVPYTGVDGNDSTNEFIGLQLTRNNNDGAGSRVTFGSDIYRYNCTYSKINSIEFTDNILDDRIIVADDILEFMNTYFTKENTASVMTLADEPTPTAEQVTWTEVERSESAEFFLYYPLLDTSGIRITNTPAYNAFYERYSMPNMVKYRNTMGIPIPSLEVDYTSWIGTAVGGFLNMELMPNFAIGGVLAILIGFSIVMLFLKYFAGG